MGAIDDDELARGRTLGRYVVLDVLGRGAMGSVYAAYDPELMRRVALKVLRSGAVARQGQEAARQWLLREAQALARLAHPNVVRVFDVGLDQGCVFLAMELVEGQSLRRWLEVPRGWREVLEVLEQAGRGLAAAHALGLVHRDFKPDNVLVAADGRVRVGDFGLVRRVDDDAESATGGRRDAAASVPVDAGSPRTAAGEALGTPAYMAPEQHAGGEVGPLADQYAFCVTLFEALYDRRPFDDEGDRAALFEAKRRGLDGDVASRGAMGRVPASVRAVVRRGLSPALADRFTGMEPLLGVLARARARVGLGRAVGAVGLVVLGGLGVAVARSDGPALPCAGAGEAPSAAWGEASRGAVVQRLGEPPPGVEVASAVAAVDRWVAEWVAADREACEATWARGEQSLVRLDARVTCLREQWIELEETVVLLREADAAMAARASAVVGGLPPPAACADVRSRASVAGEPAAGPSPAAARRILARVAVLRRAARFEEAWAELEVLGAESSGRALARGQLLEDRGEHGAGAQELARALRLARAEGDVRTEAAAWQGLAAAARAGEGVPERADFYGRMAAAAWKAAAHR